MKPSFSDMTRDIARNPGALRPIIDDVLQTLRVIPPDDYVLFLAASNGGEGPVGSTGYLVLWPVEQLVSLNAEYHVAEFAPSFVIFGSDGGDTAYAFDRRNPGRIVSIPFVGMRDDTSAVLGNSFSEFLERVAEE